jgi:NADP-dependent 3-hydroxy-3-methylglutaryl-CoA reductase
VTFTDKRQAERAQEAEARTFQLRIDTPEGFREGDVLDISHRAMRVAFPEGLGEGMNVGAVIRDAHLVSETEGLETLLDLTVLTRMLPEDSGAPVLRLGAHDDESRAHLWKLLIKLRGGELGSEPRAQAAPSERPPKIPSRGLYTEAARLERLAFAREQTGATLASLDQFDLQAERLTGNIENLIGSVSVPVGIAGPLLFHGEQVEGSIYAPLATTEGALVASATRGATAITRSGGVTTRVIRQRMMRVPLFILTDMQGASLFCRWIADHVTEIRAQVGKVSRYAKLISLDTRMLGNMVHVAFVYETGDAAGQNMTTTCTWQACQWMMAQMAHYEEIRFDNFIIEANMSGDKKVNYQSFIAGRGTRVLAEAFLSEAMLQAVLKVDSKLLLTAHHGFVAGSVQIGMVGYNINVANIVAAMFTACGQDIACVHESSVAQLHLEGVEGGVYASMLMPCLIVGTVGGGTHVQDQKDLLDLMGCAGSGHSRRLAEIIAGFCLSLDLSTLAAIASGQFATAHEKMGRNRPVEWLKREELDPGFFQRGLREALDDPNLEVTSLQAIEGLETGSSIITELTARKVNKLVGHFPFEVTYTSDKADTDEASTVTPSTTSPGPAGDAGKRASTVTPSTTSPGPAGGAGKRASTATPSTTSPSPAGDAGKRASTITTTSPSPAGDAGKRASTVTPSTTSPGPAGGAGKRASTIRVMAKVKPLDEEVVLMINSLASMCGGTLASLHNKFKRRLGFTGCHTRELGVFAQTAAPFQTYLPRVYGVIEEPEREIYVLVMELLESGHAGPMALMDTADDTSAWTHSDIEAAITGLAELHSVWYGREDELMAQPWLGPVMTSDDMIEMRGLWEALEVHGTEEFPELIDRRILQYYLSFVRSLEDWWPKMAAMPRTLIHNDCNPRNACLRETPEGRQLVIYDWELATLGLPQHDLAEFLIFTLQPDVTKDEVHHHVELHRKTLEQHVGHPIDPEQWLEGYKYSLLDLCVNRFALYMMAHTFRHYPFMERVVKTARKLVRMEVSLG